MSKQYRVSLPASDTELTQVLERLQEDALEEPDRQLLIRLVQQLLGSSGGKPLSGPPPEAGKNASALTAESSETTSLEQETQESKRPGHGRRSVNDYPGAQRVSCHDPLRQPGDRCACGGRLYPTRTPAVFLRFTGQPLVGATCYEQTVLRCSTCQQRFPAPLPEGVPAEKYDATADVAVVMAKYAAGLPFHRLAQMQESYGVPLPPSVQWERVEAVADALLPVYLYLRTLAAQAGVLIGDDTCVQILSCYQENQQRAVNGQRHGLHTTGIVAQSPDKTQLSIVLYVSGRQHAGENVGELLELRPAEQNPPLQVGDALAANWSHSSPVITVKCLAHARRQFTDIEDMFPEECGHVREEFATVYHYDSQTVGMTPEQRRAHHQLYSAPVLERLQSWIKIQFEQRRVEPNSALGKALAYLQRHWEGLTQFLRFGNAPLDTSAVERALKRVVLHRKNALFFRTEQGSAVGDLLMSVIETCRANGIRAADYLMQVMRNARAVRDNPAQWLPWNYAAQAISS
ncbi:MAG: IS66 family transposase [Acidobacteriaceae bacterium]|nr:IS66 family transposase [Acidobacteriaceae bacterium]MBV9308847.1 IS66 family transposase [Acidobacteriaceae bacterium]